MILEVVVALFVATQLCYFVVNCGLLGLLARRPTNEVDERTLGRVLREAMERDEYRRNVGNPRRPPRVHTDGGETSGTAATASTTAAQHPGQQGGRASDSTTEIDHGPGPRCRLPASRLRRIHVFVPVVRDRWHALDRTLLSIAVQSYPTSLLTVYLVYEPPEPTEPELEGVIGADRPAGLEVVPVEVDRDALEPGRREGRWCFDGAGVTQSTAALLTGAYAAQPIADDDVVTVFDPGTWVPVDTFELAVAGLEGYDVVQAKRTVRDVDAGLLPLLESMATAAWSDLAYKSSKGTYHLLEEAYFIEAGAMNDVDEWRRTVSGDLTLGMAASRRGYTLGVLDRYVRSDCPRALEGWIRRKREWTGGLYRQLLARGWTGVDDLRVWTGTLLFQALSVVSIVGLPVTVLVGILVAGGVTALPFPLQLVVGFNVLVWGYAGVRAYRSAWKAVPFRSHPHRIAYSVVSNPIVQVLYATLWAIPIAGGIVDVARHAVSSPPSEPGKFEA